MLWLSALTVVMVVRLIIVNRKLNHLIEGMEQAHRMRLLETEALISSALTHQKDEERRLKIV